MAFEGLSSKLQNVFKKLSGRGKLSEKEVKEAMREQPLPELREEFENRAVLFQILLELEQFLEIKKKFVEELSAEEIGKFWRETTC